MKELPKVRFKLAWNVYNVGDLLQPTGVLRDWLVARGYVDVVDNTAVPKSVDVVVTQPVKRKRGRPRKHPVPT